MANIIKYWHLTPAQLTGMTNGLNYYLAGTAANTILVQTGLPTGPTTDKNSITFDISQYQTVRAFVGCGTLTTSAGGIVTLDHLFPDLSANTVSIANGLQLEGVNLATLAASNALWFIQTIGAFNSSEASSKQTRLAQCAVRISFTTVPTVASDMYIMLLGFGWKSERND
jgi:hypothetical protein